MNKPTRNVLIHQISSYLPKEKIQFQINKVTKNIEIIFTDKKAIITILEDNTWDEIKHHIDAKISKDKTDECSICSTEEIQKRRVTCTKCASDWCTDCYINIFRVNKGIIKCPFCRFTYGEEFPDCMIETGVKEIVNTIRY